MYKSTAIRRFLNISTELSLDASAKTGSDNGLGEALDLDEASQSDFGVGDPATHHISVMAGDIRGPQKKETRRWERRVRLLLLSEFTVSSMRPGCWS